MLAEQPSLTPAAIKTIIKESARPFVDSDCNTAKCGAGLADAAAALRATLAPRLRYGGVCMRARAHVCLLHHISFPRAWVRDFELPVCAYVCVCVSMCVCVCARRMVV